MFIEYFTEFYLKCWCHGNEIYHKPEIERKYVIKQLTVIKTSIKNSNKSDTKTCLQAQPINLDQTSTKNIRMKKRCLVKIQKTAKKRVQMISGNFQ